MSKVTDAYYQDGAFHIKTDCTSYDVWTPDWSEDYGTEIQFKQRHINKEVIESILKCLYLCDISIIYNQDGDEEKLKAFKSKFTTFDMAFNAIQENVDTCLEFFKILYTITRIGDILTNNSISRILKLDGSIDSYNLLMLNQIFVYGGIYSDYTQNQLDDFIHNVKVFYDYTGRKVDNICDYIWHSFETPTNSLYCINPNENKYLYRDKNGIICYVNSNNSYSKTMSTSTAFYLSKRKEYRDTKRISCECCGRTYPEFLKNLTEIENGKFVCEFCKPDLKRCTECNKFMFSGGYNYDDDCLCRDCYEKKEKYIIKSYHDNPRLEYYRYDKETGQNTRYASSPRSTFQGYGIELEVGKAGQQHKESEKVLKILKEEAYTMRDGSINRNGVLGYSDYECGGFEIITHPHTEEALFNMNWKDAFKELLRQGYRSHDIKTCGLHIHISRTLFNDAEAISKMMYFYDKFRPEILKFSRRKESEAERWAKPYLEDPCSLSDYYDLYDEYNKSDNHNDRYYAVNITNNYTIEVRIMRCTLKLSTFLATLDFMITVAKNANRVPSHDIDNLYIWLEGMKPETYRYMAERNCFNLFNREKTINENLELEDNIKIEEEEE